MYARADTQDLHSLPACLLVQLSQLSDSEPKLMGKTNDQKEEAQSQGQGQDTATAAGLEILEAILGPFGNVN